MTPAYNFDTPINRRGTHSVKWDITEPGTLPLWVADMDFTSPPEVIAALDAAVSHGVFGYPFFDEEIKQAVVDWMADRHQWEIEPEDVLFLPGVVTGFNLAAKLGAQPGEGVLVQTPAYGPFFSVAKYFDLAHQEMELKREPSGQYVVDPDTLEAAITPETRVFMLCNPQNPTGRVFTQPELEEIAATCLRHRVLICSDEIHSDLIFSGHKHIPIASLDAEIAAQTITLIAPSKTFNIAGLAASVAIIQNANLRQRFEDARQGLVGWVNLLGMVAMQAAYQHGAPWLEALLAYLEANRDHTYEFVNTRLPGVQMDKPEGTYLAWLDCRGIPGDQKPEVFFKERANLYLNGGEWFGKGGAGFVRLNFGCPRQTLEEALLRMEKALKSG